MKFNLSILIDENVSYLAAGILTNAHTYFRMVLRWIRLVHIFQMYISHLTCTLYSEKKTEHIHKERTVANKIKKKNQTIYNSISY